MNLKSFRRILREEVIRVLSEGASTGTVSAVNGHLYVAGKKTKLTIDLVAKDPIDDVKVNKAVMNSDGTLALSLQAGDLKKDVNLEDQDIIRDVFTAVSRGKPYTYSKFGNSFTVTPIA